MHTQYLKDVNSRRCVSVERSVDYCWRGREIRSLKDEEKKILRRLIEVMLISEKTL